MTGASEATIRRDIAALHVQGGCAACAAAPRRCTRRSSSACRAGPSRSTKRSTSAQKRAIARAAVELCEDGEPIIINGGTTTFQMVHFLTGRRLPVLHQLLPDRRAPAEAFANTVMVPGGTIYREQNIILSPFDNDVTRNFYAKRMFMGAQGVGPLGLMEADPLLIQAEQS